MWPLYDPSIYQPPSPTTRLTEAQFAAVLKDMQQKPDVDNVFEIMSTLRGQENFGPGRLTLRQYLFHPFMIVPVSAFVAGVAIIVVRHPRPGPSGAVPGGPLGVFSQQTDVAQGGASMLILFAVGLFVVLLTLRAAFREKDPRIKGMRAAAAAAIAGMALNPKYVHEPFSPIDAEYLGKLLKGRSYDADRALEILLSNEPAAGEPDPEFRPRQRSRS
jgi:hypothetical protein